MTLTSGLNGVALDLANRVLDTLSTVDKEWDCCHSVYVLNHGVREEHVEGYCFNDHEGCVPDLSDCPAYRDAVIMIGQIRTLQEGN